ncbi:maker723 [Drosophila busckii]|uniref:Maker723 n=1 Tax=Drosophila busckii TaxID=30019 RepID=A0A0M4F0W6_DROBS|nr:maker723 [Drosophila busckii]
MTLQTSSLEQLQAAATAARTKPNGILHVAITEHKRNGKNVRPRR